MVLVPVPSFHLLNNMSVVGSFVKRNRYSTEAREWGEEEPSLVNLIFSKRARVLTCVRASLSACVVCVCLPYSWSPSHRAQLSPVRLAIPLGDKIKQ